MTMGRGGVFGNPVLIQQNDPSTLYRLNLSRQLLGQAGDSSPVQHPMQGVGRVAQALLGAYMAKTAMGDYADRQKASSDTMAKALQAGQTAKPFTDPDTGQVAPGTQPSNVMARMLMGNPDTAGMGMQMQMGQIGREQELASALRLAREKQKLEPPKSRTVKRNGVEVTEQYDPSTRTWTEVGQSGIGLVSPEAEEQKRRIAEAGRPQNIGSIPPGFQLETGPDGAQRMVPIPGSPAAQKQADANRARVSGQTQRTVAADIVTEDIDRALGIINSSETFTTGVGGALLKDIPGTDARDVRGLIDTVKANVGFDKLQAMRDASPTGGALGQVSQMENQLMQAVIGNLEQSQSADQLRYNLQRVRDTYSEIIHQGISPEEAGQRLNALRQRRRDAQKPAQNVPQPGVTEDGYRFKGGNPGDPNNWEKVE